MRYLNYILSIALLFLLTACSLRVGEEKLVDRSGNGRWRQDLPESVFVGVSRHGRSEAEAVADATLNARLQIVESLGLMIEVESFQQARDTLRSGIVEAQVNQDTRSRVYASALVEVKPDKVYWEKWMRLTEQGPVYTWKAWVRVPFSRQRHKTTWLSFVHRATSTYSNALAAFPHGNDWPASRIADFIEQLDALLRNEEDFAGQLWLIQHADYQKFIEVKQAYGIRLRHLAASLKLFGNPPRDIFAGSFPLAVTRDGMPVPGIPVHVSSLQIELERTIYTDERGEARVPYRFTGPAPASVGLKLGTQRMARHFGDSLPSLELCLLSPYDRNSIGVAVWLFCDPDEKWLQNRLLEGLQETGYRAGSMVENAVYRVEARFEAESAPRTANLPDLHVATAMLDLRLVRDRDREVILTYSLPNERFFDTRGFGRNETEALGNSLKLANMSLREECLRSIIRRLDRAIQKDVRHHLP
ncbi:MAG: hypothetical protein K8R90_00920 [Candidatus Cloacimonetes bacterium]|nr:hypothetical protein [Candidatus Cloacimonadota bacterium]